MAIVIVTKNQYLLAMRIHHIVMNEQYEYHDVRTTSGRLIGTRETFYDIIIQYTPDTASNSISYNGSPGREETRECNVRIRGRAHAYEVYKDLIRQIREQMPDQLFLDKALETLLGDNDFEVLAEDERKDEMKLKAVMNDRRTKKIRRARKAKRASKAILRKSKKRR